jgi:hypothetical protein
MITKHNHPYRGQVETHVFSSDETVFIRFDSGISSQTFYLTPEIAKDLVTELQKAIAEPNYE